MSLNKSPLFALAAVLSLAVAPASAADPGLAVLMERMQTYTHKLQLSLEARNALLADFYLHELEETAEYVAENIESYHDRPVGALVQDMLMPQIERLEDAVEARQWSETDSRFVDLLRACNACHMATEHGYIRIAPAEGNPFAQDFSVHD
jgi:hypothetical protein